MRKLHKAIVSVAGAVTVAAVALSLLPSAAAATPSAGDCYSQLNAVRAEAGSPAASATALPALAKSAAAHASYRTGAGVDGHADKSQHHQTPGRPGFTGASSDDRSKAAGLQDGTWSSQFENVTTTSGELHGVQSWVDAPYHRFPMLDANNLAAGCATASARGFLGRTHSAAVLELAADWDATTKRLTAYPAPGQTDVPVSFDRLRERPSPFADAAATVGYTVSFQADGYTAVKIDDMTLTNGAGRSPVAVHKSVRFGTSAASGTVDANLPANAAMLAATRPLEAATTYHVRVSGSVMTESGAWTAFPTTSWSFTTA
jgi:hypothetical protein